MSGNLKKKKKKKIITQAEMFKLIVSNLNGLPN